MRRITDHLFRALIDSMSPVIAIIATVGGLTLIATGIRWAGVPLGIAAASYLIASGSAIGVHSRMQYEARARAVVARTHAGNAYLLLDSATSPESRGNRAARVQSALAEIEQVSTTLQPLIGGLHADR